MAPVQAQDHHSRPADTTAVSKDSLHLLPDSSIKKLPATAPKISPIIKEQGNRRPRSGQQIYFYVIVGLFLYLGILKAAYGKYFSNMVRVFFNTSFRQMQLTDQLLIAQLPSLLFNIFFMLVGGTYLFLMASHFYPLSYNPYILWAYAVLVIMAVYLVKYLSIRFTGWVTGFSTDAGAYMFIVFLVNKMLAVVLLPFVTLIAFSSPFLRDWGIYASIVVISLAFAVRYLRSYGLMREKHKMSFFHFLLYIMAVEVLPILIVFHFAMNILSKKM